MKLRLPLAVAGSLALASAAYADRSDEQSIYQISGTQVLTITSGTTRTTEIPNNAVGIRVAGNVGVHMRVGNASVTANTSNTFIPVGPVEYIKIRKNDGNYAAFTRRDTDGLLWVDFFYE